MAKSCSGIWSEGEVNTMALSRRYNGFTLIGLLVVLLTIGLLVAIGLPSFLRQINRAKEVEAKQNVGTCLRLQQAYFVESGEFAVTPDTLSASIPTETENYVYGIDWYIPVVPTSRLQGAFCCVVAAKKPRLSSVAIAYTHNGEAIMTDCNRISLSE